MPKTSVPKLSSYATDSSKFYIMDLRTNEVFDIPFPPTEISERPNSPSYTGENVIGRTSQFVTYTYSDNRTISFNMTILDDYIPISLMKVRDILSSMVMPSYQYGQIQQPAVQVRLGSLVMRGVPTEMNFSWSGIWRNGSWNTLTVTFSVKEARELPLGSAEVRAGGWNNG